MITEKSQGIDNFLTKIAGISRQEADSKNICAICKGPADIFRNEISRREYSISTLCQKCQDEVFGED